MTLTVTPQNPSVGQDVEIHIEGSSRANEKVSVQIDDGKGNSASVSVQLDANGDGDATWTAADWDVANFNYGSCPQVTVFIEPAGLAAES